MSAETELASLDGDVDRLRISSRADVSDALAELLAQPTILGRVVALGEWLLAYPRATAQLLRVIAADREASVALASTVLAARILDDEDADDILVTAFVDLAEPLRDAAADRPGVRRRVGATTTPLAPPDPAWLWPEGKPLPPADTVEGVQARLNALGLGAGPVDGEWTELTRRAFVRWQVLRALEPTGELDIESIDQLGLE
jgi:hypothetical protein